MSLRGWNLPQVLLCSLTCIQVIQEPSTAITTDKIGKSRMYTSTRVQGKQQKCTLNGGSSQLNKLQGTEVSALFLNAWKKESCNVYVLMTLLSRSARRVNVTNVNTTSCSSVFLLPCGKRVSFRQTRGWEQPKLARNEKISLSRQPQL